MATLKLREAKVAELREAKGLTSNHALAQAMHIDAGNLSRILRGKYAFGVRSIAGLSVALDTGLDDLFEVIREDTAA